jgi:predicted SAM-dependent methyltransferase
LRNSINYLKEEIKKLKHRFIVNSYLKNHSKRKIIVGSGGINGLEDNSDWLATDIEFLDITKASDWQKLLSDYRLDNILAEHVWEHLSDEDTRLANVNCFNYLNPNGVLRLAVPDGFHPNIEYIHYVKPGGVGAGADDHKILYNYKTMKDSLEIAGFKVQLLEYWDESEKFNSVEWTDEGGRIRRSKRYDDRNKNGTLEYTSLIVDAIKK